MELTKVKATIDVEFSCADGTAEMIRNGDIYATTEKVKEYLKNDALINRTIKNIHFSIENRDISNVTGENHLPEAKELAKRLNNIIYSSTLLNGEDYKYALDNSLVVAYSMSKNILELDGAISAVSNKYEDGEFKVSRMGFEHSSEDGDGRVIKCDWLNENIAAEYGQEVPISFVTDIPHAKFAIYADNELWCIGIVFSVKDL